MENTSLLSLIAAPLLASCASVSVGVGVGGSSGGLGADVSTSVDAGASQRSTGNHVIVPMFRIDAKGVGEEIGTLMLRDTRAGLAVEPALSSLPPGSHGFHLHEFGNCGPEMKDGKMQAGMAAGGHFDPSATGKHAGPNGNGHQGDLPILEVDKNGNAIRVVSALHLSISETRGRAFVVHAGGDNYADQPKPLGGGGARIACGVVPTRE